MASERGEAQTVYVQACRRCISGVVGAIGTAANVPGSYKILSQANDLERSAIEGESPVGGRVRSPFDFLSTTGHVLSCGKPAGPPAKAKYYLITDSEQVP